jgi:hypothetical protein
MPKPTSHYHKAVYKPRKKTSTKSAGSDSVKNRLSDFCDSEDGEDDTFKSLTMKDIHNDNGTSKHE